LPTLARFEFTTYYFISTSEIFLTNKIFKIMIMFQLLKPFQLNKTFKPTKIFKITIFSDRGRDYQHGDQHCQLEPSALGEASPTEGVNAQNLFFISNTVGRFVHGKSSKLSMIAESKAGMY
jgi:hypothetical protein